MSHPEKSQIGCQYLMWRNRQPWVCLVQYLTRWQRSVQYYRHRILSYAVLRLVGMQDRVFMVAHSLWNALPSEGLSDSFFIILLPSGKVHPFPSCLWYCLIFSHCLVFKLLGFVVNSVPAFSATWLFYLITFLLFPFIVLFLCCMLLWAPYFE